MASPAISLDVIQVASPCEANWNDMSGNAQVRHCATCHKHVYNLSEMTRDEAEALIVAQEGKLCVKFFRRADGTILTADCPIGLWEAAHRKMSYWLASAAALLVGLVAMGVGMTRSWNSTPTQGFMGGMQVVLPTSTCTEEMMGEMVVAAPEEAISPSPK